jgi:nucleoid DNA-binding protein
MKKPAIAKIMARQAGVTPAEAADQLDNVIREILAGLRQGREADCPGLGRFRHGAGGKLVFEPEKGRPHD